MNRRRNGKAARQVIALAGFFIWSTTHSQTAAFDDFERTALGPNWTITAGGNTVVAIINNSDLGMSNGPATTLGGAGSEWVGSILGVDQYSETGLASNKPDSMLCQVYVRHRTSDNARYGFHWNNAFGGRWEIKYDGVPTAQTRIVSSWVGPAPRPGDTIRIEAAGRLLTGKLNGAVLLSALDTAANAIVTAGQPGIVFRYTITYLNAYPVSVIEWWRGGTFPPTGIRRDLTRFRNAQHPQKIFFLDVLGREFKTTELEWNAGIFRIGRPQ